MGKKIEFWDVGCIVKWYGIIDKIGWDAIFGCKCSNKLVKYTKYIAYLTNMQLKNNEAVHQSRIIFKGYHFNQSFF